MLAHNSFYNFKLVVICDDDNDDGKLNLLPVTRQSSLTFNFLRLENGYESYGLN